MPTRILSGSFLSTVKLIVVTAMLLVMLPASRSRAEVQELRLARQYGISHLQMALLEELKLIEKSAQKSGMPNLKVSWS